MACFIIVIQIRAVMSGSLYQRYSRLPNSPPQIDGVAQNRHQQRFCRLLTATGWIVDTLRLRHNIVTG